MLPARPDELERVRLDLEVRRRHQRLEQLRGVLQDEQTEQDNLRKTIDSRLASLRADGDRLTAEIARLESRLERIMMSGSLLTDEELDEKEDDVRADEAAWWAEWRHRQSERRPEQFHHRSAPKSDDITLRQIYRTLARLVHPDRARDSADRARREHVMRIANEAKEAQDIETLRRLLTVWSRSDEEGMPYSVETLRARVGELSVEYNEVRRQISTLRETTIGRLLRVSERELRRHLRNEEGSLRREVALQRLRRRRLLRALEQKRSEISRAYADSSHTTDY